MKERLIGVALLIAGGMLCYFCVYQPIESARNGSPTVSVSLKGAIAAPAGLIGVLYLVMGARVTKVMGTREEPTPAAYAIGIGAVVLGLVLHFVVRSTLEFYGYNFNGRF